MLLAEAKSYIGKVCTVQFLDRNGKEQNVVSKIYDATYVPLYGGYLVTDMDDIRLDRICEVTAQDDAALSRSQETVAA